MEGKIFCFRRWQGACLELEHSASTPACIHGVYNPHLPRRICKQRHIEQNAARTQAGIDDGDARRQPAPAL